MRVPAFDLGAAAAEIAPEVKERWRWLLQETAFVGGGEVVAFEEAFAAFLGGSLCAVANGTDALELALRTLGVEPGDEVLVPDFTFIGTATAVLLAGARPVLVDVDAETLNLDPARAEEAMGERTVGVIGVHLYGRPFAVEPLRELCRSRGLWLLEDAAQAHGARWRGERVGTLGELATWSFYPSKNLGCFGDGGAVSGPRGSELVERLRRLGNHGQGERYLHLEVGRNSRLDALQAAVLSCRLPHLDRDNARRRHLADLYREGLEGVGDLRWPRDPEESEPVYHQMTVLTRRRDALREHLAADGIGSTVHYPRPLHSQPALADLGADPERFPVAAEAAASVLCLPMYPQLREDHVEQVCESVRAFFAGRSPSAVG